ncbi:hypothetical protein [Alicyclobacillus sendaiensis]|uniref:hypothetical protein n=1 Tax=Alicyclobacillus sendaiensis TaxID=192387 RepID=UPI0026F46865|nr:hypothetical protein [Alicyclobacillus sendaiensis]
MTKTRLWFKIFYIIVFTVLFSLLNWFLGWTMEHFYKRNAIYTLFYALAMIVAFFISFVSNLWISAFLFFGRQGITSWSYSLRRLIVPFIFCSLVVFLLSVLFTQTETHFQFKVWKVINSIIFFTVASAILSFFGIQFSCVVLDAGNGFKSSISQAISLIRKAPGKVLCVSIVINGIISLIAFFANRLTQHGINYTIEDTTLILFGPLWILGFLMIYRRDFMQFE